MRLALGGGKLALAVSEFVFLRPPRSQRRWIYVNMSNLGKVTHYERDGSITLTAAGTPRNAGDAAAACQQSVEWHLIQDAAAALQGDGSRAAVRVAGRNVGLLKWRCDCCT